MTSTKARSVALAAVAVVACAGFLLWQSAGDSVDESGTARPSTTIATSTTQMTPTTPPENEPYASLAAVLPLELEGYRVDTGAKATGALDLDAAVAAEADTQAERSLLETRHFQVGYGRAFTSDETDVYMVVYAFADEEDAALYLVDGFITLQGRGVDTYDVSDVPDARGFTQADDDGEKPGVIHGVAFAKGPRFVLVFTRSASTSTPEEATALASTLYPRA